MRLNDKLKFLINMNILAIDTSCDETAAAVTNGRKVISNVIYSQVLIHTKWGGVVPVLAKRAHEERIDFVVEQALKKAKMTIDDIDTVAVTYGPGLAIALEVGIKKAQQLVTQYNKKCIAVNHMEGHLYSAFVQNSKGNPDREIQFPFLALLVSGGHTELVLVKDYVSYEILGETRDDAAGESLDKAAKMLGFGYPGGPIIERLAEEVKNEDIYKLPRPMLHSQNLEFSFSGLKTSFLYFLKNFPEDRKSKEIRHLASSFQEAVFDTLVVKTEQALKNTAVNRLLVGGGVGVNKHLRSKLQKICSAVNVEVFFPSYKYLNFDNASMIGVAAYFRAQKGLYNDPNNIDRVPRLSLLQSSIK